MVGGCIVVSLEDLGKIECHSTWLFLDIMKIIV
jgi:hypothetical protein